MHEQLQKIMPHLDLMCQLKIQRNKQNRLKSIDSEKSGQRLVGDDFEVVPGARTACMCGALARAAHHRTSNAT